MQCSFPGLNEENGALLNDQLTAASPQPQSQVHAARSKKQKKKNKRTNKIKMVFSALVKKEKKKSHKIKQNVSFEFLIQSFSSGDSPQESFL